MREFGGFADIYYDTFWGGVAGEGADFFEGVVFWFGGGAVGSEVGLALVVGAGGGVGAEEGVGDVGGGFEGGGGGRTVCAFGL